MNRSKLFLMMWLTAALALISGCSGGVEEGGDFRIYYLNEEGTSLKTSSYEVKSDTQDEMIDEVIKKLCSQEEGYVTAIPQAVSVLSHQMTNDVLSLNFSSEYEELDCEKEIFARASIVLTLTQLDFIDYVSFYVDDRPLKDAMGDNVGMMSASNFIDKVGNTLNNYDNTTVTLYFANVNGSRLRTELRTGMYDSSKSLERYIVEQIIEGPSSAGNYKTVPSGTKILSINTNNGVCYVDFSSEFMKGATSVKDEIMIYSIVNSLTELSHISKVQISVEGEVDIELHGRLSLNTMYVKTLSYMEQ